MLPLLQWLDRAPLVYAFAFVLVGFAVATLVAWLPREEGKLHPLARAALPWVWLLLLLAGRWPQLFVVGELNPDSSQFLAGALTLRHDPVFWRSVDGMTAGPLIYYTLTLVSWLGMPLTYFTARLVALVLFGITFAAAHRLIAAHHGPRVAGFALLPTALFFALTTDPDFNHYSSELVPLALIMGAATLFLHPGRQTKLPALLMGAVLAGAVPWAKLQAAPIAAALGLLVVVRVLRDPALPTRARLGRAAMVVGAALLPTIGFLGLVTFAHSFSDFYRSYIVQNLLYTDPGRGALLGAESRLLRGDFATLGYATVLLTAFAGLALALPRRPSPQPLSPLLPAGGLMLGVAFLCVITPGRDFLHYTLLLLPGLLLLSGAAVGEGKRALRRARIGGLIALSCLTLLVLRVDEPKPATLGQLASNYRTPDSKLGELVKLLSASDRQVGVWGWEMQLYVESGARQATRSAYSYWQITQGPQRDYFRARYLGDLQRNRPPVFVDAVGEATKFFHGRDRLAHETFPELAEFIAREYCLVAELRFARVYARRDLLVGGRFPPKEIWRAFRVARGSEYLNSPDPLDLHRFDLPREMVGRRSTVVLRPPAQLTFPLDGTERELRFGYGYLPEAELQETGNGTELIVAVTDPDGRERILRQLLHAPAHNPAQRGHRVLRVLLPPDLRSGSTLTIATDTGPHGDNAWDWLYITQAGFVRSQMYNPRQFPAFNRPPDEIDAPLSTVNGSYGNPELSLHAPARLRFRLSGYERGLFFTFGLRPGAFTGEGRSDGATFRVTLTAPEQTPRVLYDRTLQPATRAPDRREQTAELELSDIPAGSTLEIEIDPGASDAWDWTYISSLRLG